MKHLSEADLERVALEHFSQLGYEATYGPEISPGGRAPERDDYPDVVLVRRLRESLEGINPDLPSEAET